MTIQGQGIHYKKNQFSIMHEVIVSMFLYDITLWVASSSCIDMQ